MNSLVMDKPFPFLHQFIDPYEDKKRESCVMAKDLFPDVEYSWQHNART